MVHLPPQQCRCRRTIYPTGFRWQQGLYDPAHERDASILTSAHTGEVGDGKVFVLPVEKVYRIRTREEDEAAVTPQIAPRAMADGE